MFCSNKEHTNAFDNESIDGFENERKRVGFVLMELELQHSSVCS